MHPVETLKEDHETISDALTGIRDLAERASRGKAEPAEVEETIDFVREFADAYHHEREEKILFEKLARRGMPVRRGPIGEMMTEHDEAREIIDDVEEELEDGDLKAAGEGLESYAELLEEHVDKENEALFEMARERFLQEGDAEELAEQLREVEEEAGEGFLERHRSTAERLGHKG